MGVGVSPHVERGLIRLILRGRVGALLDGLNRGSQVLGIGLSRYPHSAVLSHQRSTATLNESAQYLHK